MGGEGKKTQPSIKAKILLVSGLLLVLGLIIFLVLRLSGVQMKGESLNDQAFRKDENLEENYLTDFYQDKKYDGDDLLDNDPFAKTCEDIPKGAVLFGGTTCLR